MRRLRDGFGQDDSGAVALIFGLSVFMLFFCVGLAIDGSRAYNVSARVGSALDAAALAGAKLLDQGGTDAAIRLRAEAYFNAHTANVRVPGTTFRGLIVEINRADSTVKVAVDVAMPTTFAQVAHVNAFEFPKQSTVTVSSKRVELAMVLDVTGSMNNGGRLDAMKTAARDVVDSLIDTAAGRPSQNKIGLAPYAASVNVGSYFGAVAAGPSALGDTCVIERMGAASQEDRAPSAGARVDVMTTPPPDPANADYHYSCPSAEVMAMTSDRNDLNSQIQGFDASGWTAGHIGAAWGWHLVSPNWGGVWGDTPAAYADRNVIKAVLIMTDGVFNTAYKNGHALSYESQVADAYAEFGQLCTAMKAEGIKVYTVAFALASEPEPHRTRALEAMSACASSPAHFFDADTNDQLRVAFQSVAEQLNSMRIKS